MSYNPDEIAIEVSHVSKSYKIFDTPGQRFLYHMFHTKLGRDFVALNDINFEIKKGEAFGIIGRNGSGKSTMLQILAGIIKATSGEIKVNGRIAALLELGSGFNPESTGLENIYMNAAILGVSKERIEKKINEIIEFADIGDFINQPVKTYSSGMFVRLAFSVAINVDADILLIDEALAVGDVFFRQKCYTKLNQLKEEGKTIILVSHGMNEVEQFCDRALLINKGKQIELGDSRKVVQKYYIVNEQSEVNESGTTDLNNSNEDNSDSKAEVELGDWKLNDTVFYDLTQLEEVGGEKAHIIRMGLFDEKGKARRSFHQGEWAYFYTEVDILANMDVPSCGIVLRDQKNIIVHGKDCYQVYMELPQTITKGSTMRVLQKIELSVGVGDYTFDVGVASLPIEYYQKRSYLRQEEIDAVTERLAVLSQAGSFSVHKRNVGAPMQLAFHGCADLNGEFLIDVVDF